MGKKFTPVKCTSPLQCQRVVVEATGEDVRTVHVCNLKPCFPTAEEIDTQEKQKILEIFQESLSEDEEFLGF